MRPHAGQLSKRATKNVLKAFPLQRLSIYGSRHHGRYDLAAKAFPIQNNGTFVTLKGRKCDP